MASRPTTTAYDTKATDEGRLCDSVGMITYPNGEKYTGPLKNGLRSGEGIYHYRNGDKYDGEWKDDQRNGKGRV